jgi:TRAP-type mannitol/chloroaromatic compound transport system permease large subunit
MILLMVILVIILTLLVAHLRWCWRSMLSLHSTGVDFLRCHRDFPAMHLSCWPSAFTFAGYLLSERTSQQLVRFSQSFFGWVPGGLGMVALVCSAFFTAITGATGVTIIALGGLLLPALLSQNYGEKFSLGLITTSGSIGLTFAPSLPIILYGFVSGASIEKLFMAGILPGILTVGALSLFSLAVGRKLKLDSPPFSFPNSETEIRCMEAPSRCSSLSASIRFCTCEAAALTVVCAHSEDPRLS